MIICTVNNFTKSLNFIHQEASGTSAQKSLNGALVGNTTHSRTGEYTPLGRNIASAGPYITFNTAPPADEGGVDLFGSSAGYRPGRNTYTIDGLTVSEDEFMMEINSGRIGGAFGLLEMSARMSAREVLGYTVTVRDGHQFAGAQKFDNPGDARAFAASRGMNTVDRWIQLNNWSVVGLLATQVQRQDYIYASQTANRKKLSLFDLTSVGLINREQLNARITY